MKVAKPSAIDASLLVALCLMWVRPATPGPYRFKCDDIEFWIGSGDERSRFWSIDWDGASDIDESLAWGYRWDGTATGEDMLYAIR